MATKKQKRAAGEAKARREAEERRQSGLAAQKADQERRRRLKESETGEAKKISQKERSILFDKGINPRTGVLFTEEEIEGMRQRANTPERKHLLRRIEAGRAGTLNEPPPVGGVSDYIDSDFVFTEGISVETRAKRSQLLEGISNEDEICPILMGDPLKGMTVGQFRELSDKHWAQMQARMKESLTPQFSSKGDFVSKAIELGRIAREETEKMTKNLAEMED
jgi:hypothetical protein